jgi:hypothetical protein
MMVARNEQIGRVHRSHDFTTRRRETQSGQSVFRQMAAPVVRESRKFGQGRRIDRMRVGHRVAHGRLVRAAENGWEMDPAFERAQDRRPAGR